MGTVIRYHTGKVPSEFADKAQAIFFHPTTNFRARDTFIRQDTFCNFRKTYDNTHAAIWSACMQYNKNDCAPNRPWFSFQDYLVVRDKYKDRDIITFTLPCRKDRLSVILNSRAQLILRKIYDTIMSYPINRIVIEDIQPDCPHKVDYNKYLKFPIDIEIDIVYDGPELDC